MMNGLGNGILGRHFKECYNGVYVGGHFPRLAVWLQFISVGALGALAVVQIAVLSMMRTAVASLGRIAVGPRWCMDLN